MMTAERAMYLAQTSIRADSDYLRRVAMDLVTRATQASTAARNLVRASRESSRLQIQVRSATPTGVQDLLL